MISAYGHVRPKRTCSLSIEQGVPNPFFCPITPLAPIHPQALVVSSLMLAHASLQMRMSSSCFHFIDCTKEGKFTRNFLSSRSHASDDRRPEHPRNAIGHRVLRGAPWALASTRRLPLPLPALPPHIIPHIPRWDHHALAPLAAHVHQPGGHGVRSVREVADALEGPRNV